MNGIHDHHTPGNGLLAGAALGAAAFLIFQLTAGAFGQETDLLPPENTLSELVSIETVPSAEDLSFPEASEESSEADLSEEGIFTEAPSAEESSSEESSIEEPSAEEPSVEEPSVEEPSVEEPSVEEPSVEEPSVEEPSVEEPSVEEPSVEEPTSEIRHSEIPDDVFLMDIDFQLLLTRNADVVGWLFSPGTPINYVVVKGTDNEFYLKHSLDGNYDRYGTLFVDARSPAVFSYDRTIIYGHNMSADDLMLGSIVHYASQSYYESHPALYYYTPEHLYSIDLFSGYVGTGTDDAFNLTYTDSAAYSKAIDDLRRRSDFSSDVSVCSTDSILTLVTCSYAYQNARYFLHGKVTQLR